MKITKIALEGYNQFQDMGIDLTYPKGHEKAGKPLNKVCIIGQSGTGKTSLLRVIKLIVSFEKQISENIILPELSEKESINVSLDIFSNPYTLNYIGKSLWITRDESNFLNDSALGVPISEFKSILNKIKPLLIDFEDIEKKTMEYKEWFSENPNPLNMLAERCLDPVLHNLGLKTKTDIDLETIRNLGVIQLETLGGQYVPRSFWSTGTQQLVQTLTPLYQLKPDNAVVLIDEPERSLYPDIQRSIIDTYVKLAPGCQFFFATHSPIIASAFEPWEIVELKFDKNQTYVYQDKHYEGERHVDNYKYFPEYLRWDSILFRIFDLPREGGQKRLKALEELAELNVRIKKLKKDNQLESPDGKKLVDRYLALGEKLDWDLKDIKK